MQRNVSRYQRGYQEPKGLSGAEIEEEQTKTTWRKIILFEEGVVVSFRLIRSLKKFIFRYQYLVEIYSVSAEKIISDAF